MTTRGVTSVLLLTLVLASPSAGEAQVRLGALKRAASSLSIWTHSSDATSTSSRCSGIEPAVEIRPPEHGERFE